VHHNRTRRTRRSEFDRLLDAGRNVCAGNLAEAEAWKESGSRRRQQVHVADVTFTRVSQRTLREALAQTAAALRRVHRDRPQESTIGVNLEGGAADDLPVATRDDGIREVV